MSLERERKLFEEHIDPLCKGLALSSLLPIKFAWLKHDWVSEGHLAQFLGGGHFTVYRNYTLGCI